MLGGDTAQVHAPMVFRRALPGPDMASSEVKRNTLADGGFRTQVRFAVAERGEGSMMEALLCG